MAIKFSDTESFKHPIELRDVEKIVGRKISVQAPYKITKEFFSIIYNKGTQNILPE